MWGHAADSDRSGGRATAEQLYGLPPWSRYGLAVAVALS